MTKNGWHSEMANYIRNTLGDQNHLISTSFAGAEFFQPFAGMDFIDVHRYNPEKDANHKRWNELSHIWNAGVNKPAIFGEVGAYLYSGELDKQNPITQHNTMWASAFSGGFGCGLNWWWKDTHDNGGVEHYRGLAEFMRGVDFEWNDFRPFKTMLTWVQNPQGNLTEDSRTEVFYLKNQHNNQAMGWVHNRSAYWANMEYRQFNQETNEWELVDENCFFLTDINQDNYLERNTCPSDDYPDCYIEENHLYNLGQVFIGIPNLDVNLDYLIQWFNTETGLPVSNPVPLTIFAAVPPMTAAEGQSHNWAFKVWPDSEPGFRSLCNNYSSDTLKLCFSSSVLSLNLFNDNTDHEISYRQNNEKTYSIISEEDLFTRTGWYLIRYSRVNSEQVKEVIQVIVNLVDCRQDDLRDNRPNEHKKVSIKDDGQILNESFTVLPNPTDGIITVTLTGSSYSFTAFEVFDMAGKKILDGTSTITPFRIDLSAIPKGLYMLKVKHFTKSCHFKILRL